IPQNSLKQIDAVVNLPPRQPPGAPGSGGKIYLYFLIDPFHVTLDTDRTNNLTRVGVPVQIEAPFPDLQTIALSTPASLWPGDTVLAAFSVPNIPPLSAVPVRNNVLGDVTLDNLVNEVTLTGPIVTLPQGPRTYFIGVIIDPLNTIREISEIGTGPSSALEQ